MPNLTTTVMEVIRRFCRLHGGTKEPTAESKAERDHGTAEVPVNARAIAETAGADARGKEVAMGAAEDCDSGRGGLLTTYGDLFSDYLRHCSRTLRDRIAETACVLGTCADSALLDRRLQVGYDDGTWSPAAARRMGRRGRGPLSDLVDACLADERGRALYAGRLVFPVRDHQGRLAAIYWCAPDGGEDTWLGLVSPACWNELEGEAGAIVCATPYEAAAAVAAGYASAIAVPPDSRTLDERVARLHELGLRRSYIAFPATAEGQDGARRVAEVCERSRIEALRMWLPPGRSVAQTVRLHDRPDDLLAELLAEADAGRWLTKFERAIRLGELPAMS